MPTTRPLTYVRLCELYEEALGHYVAVRDNPYHSDDFELMLFRTKYENLANQLNSVESLYNHYEA